LKKIVLTICALLMLCTPALAQRKNKIWVGELNKLDFQKPKGKNPYVEITVTEDRNNAAAFGKYDIQKTIVWSPLNEPKVGAKIHLDGVFPGKFLNSKQLIKGDLVKAITISTESQGTQVPNIQNTVDGRKLQHAQIVIESHKPILVNTNIVKNLGEEIITLRFTITERKEASNSNPLTNALEFSTEEFDRPATKPIVSPFSRRQEAYIRRSLDALYRSPDSAYVTVIYPVRFADPNILANMTRGRLSALGRLDVDIDRAQIVVTDRARFVRNIIETMLALDKRAPQVTIVAQIIEVNRSEGSRLGVDFSYIGNRSGSGLNSAGFKSSGILGQDTILSGVYQNFSSKALKKFAGDVNLLLERRNAKITAQPVLRVINNRTGTFNSGEQLPFFIRTSASSLNQDRNTDNQNNLSREVGKNIIDAATVGELRATKDRFKFKEGRENYSVRTVRTGTRLTVTPNLRNSDDCVLSIKAQYNELTGWTQNTGSPIVAERSVDTRVRVRHGETIVLAGLYRQTEIKQTSGVPWISDIPLIGRLFQSERKKKETFDIIFILTTYIQR
jgi:type II secretory pathway component GspD/PulD (secretin)